MFTGLIEEVGTVKSVKKGEKSAQLTINADKVLKDIKIGDSICTNGVCLTVTGFDNNSFKVDIMPETLRSSNLNNLKIQSRVNLERALKVNDRLGGHIVSGHIDGVGTVNECIKEDNATLISIKPKRELLKYIVNKGSIAVDGTSLTVAYTDKTMFKVSIIPLTGDETTILEKKPGDKVNLECDLVGKYLERFMEFDKEKSNKSKIDEDFLKQKGFI